MKTTGMKAMIAKVMAVGVVAGGLLLAAPAKAEAQGFSVGVQIGYPHYDYSRRAYYERLRIEEARREAYERQQAWLRHEAQERHEAWVREHRYGYRGDDRNHDRDWDRR